MTRNQLVEMIKRVVKTELNEVSIPINSGSNETIYLKKRANYIELEQKDVDSGDTDSIVISKDQIPKLISELQSF